MNGNIGEMPIDSRAMTTAMFSGGQVEVSQQSKSYLDALTGLSALQNTTAQVIKAQATLLRDKYQAQYSAIQAKVRELGKENSDILQEREKQIKDGMNALSLTTGAEAQKVQDWFFAQQIEDRVRTEFNLTPVGSSNKGVLPVIECVAFFDEVSSEFKLEFASGTFKLGVRTASRSEYLAKTKIRLEEIAREIRNLDEEASKVLELKQRVLQQSEVLLAKSTIQHMSKFSGDELSVDAGEALRAMVESITAESK